MPCWSDLNIDPSRHWSLMLSLRESAGPMFATLELVADCLVSLGALWGLTDTGTGLTLGLYNRGEITQDITYSVKLSI